MLSLRRKLLEQGTTDASAFYETHLLWRVRGAIVARWEAGDQSLRGKKEEIVEEMYNQPELQGLRHYQLM
jgi:hypothetical protein